MRIKIQNDRPHYRIITGWKPVYEGGDKDEAFAAFAKAIAQRMKALSLLKPDKYGKKSGTEGGKDTITNNVGFSVMSGKALETYPEEVEVYKGLITVATSEDKSDILAIGEGVDLEEFKEVAPGLFALHKETPPDTHILTGAQGDQVLGAKYMVIQGGKENWKGNVKMEAIVAFMGAIIGEIISRGLVEEADTKLEFARGPLYENTDKETITVQIDGELAVVVVGLTLDDWRALGPNLDKIKVDAVSKDPTGNIKANDLKERAGNVLGELKNLADLINQPGVDRGALDRDFEKFLSEKKEKKPTNSPWGPARTLH
jgi:hypothetical protein